MGEDRVLPWRRRLDRSPVPRPLAVAVTLAAAAAVLLREPLLVRRPRFWAEEGYVYLQSALDRSGADALVRPHLGYYSLVDNAATVLAARVPLADAPVVTLVVSLLVMLVPVVVLLVSRSACCPTCGSGSCWSCSCSWLPRPSARCG